MKHSQRSTITPLKINMEPENTPLELKSANPKAGSAQTLFILSQCVTASTRLLLP